MSFEEILHTLLIKPLQLLFEMVYVTAEKITGNPGLSIIVLSLVVNFLVLPLYMRADNMQKEERDIEAKLQKGVQHIKKTFRGTERTMMLQTYYRQNHYKPVYALRGAVSLLLQIPFFVAAYQFLSGLQSLNGASFGPLKNLGEPDGMIVIGGLSLNALPYIMTVINLVSCMVFTKDSTLKSRIQLYAMAAFFLAFLFDSPSGLVFYWTLNNIFSLVKTMITSRSGRKQKTKISFSRVGAGTADAKVFFAGALFLSFLTGILIPSAVIESSPQEFIILNYFYTPLELVISAFFLALGVFVVWCGVFYWLAGPSVRGLFDKAVWILSGVAVADYMFFGKDLGILTTGLQYENGMDFSWKEQLGNVVIILAVILVFYLIAKRWQKIIFQVLAAGSVAVCCMSVLNVQHINASTADIREQSYDKESSQFFEDIHKDSYFSLSKTGKNVIVLMLDRAMGLYVPYIFNEKPELKEQFSGFTWYSNVISYGRTTNFGAPALFGGYEYTPLEMNKRSNEPLVKKHNEALKVMPVLFDRNNYDVTVCDAPYANYQWIPDLSIYDEYPEIETHITKAAMLSDISSKENLIQNNRRNFFCYSVMKAMPLLFQKLWYDNGSYLQADVRQTKTDGGTANLTGGDTFIENYYIMSELSSMTEITDDGTDTFLMMANDLTHCPVMLQEPDYTLADKVDNTEYEKKHKDRFELNGQKLEMKEDMQLMHYQVNMAAMMQLGKWFDYMRENDVYDNTRIILVSDHGQNLNHTESLMLDETNDICAFYPLLMVKDFNSEGFVTSEEFMTNGDVPSLATENLISQPVNPFTGKEINMDAKKEDKQYVLYSLNWKISENNGNTFQPGTWFSVQNDMRDKNNWRLETKNSVLPAAE